MSIRFAFVGFRHPHILDMYHRCSERDDIDVVACCEADAVTRKELTSGGAVAMSHDRVEALLGEVDCDVVAVGDCYGRRAEIIEAALQAGRHVISDKPLCISVSELDLIERTAEKANRYVGCMLDMRDLAVYRGMRNLIQDGAIGEVQSLNIEGQHPLLYGKRPSWYFQKGMHGGVLNDILVHAMDFVPWATGLSWKTVVGARCWNATVPQHPHFMQCGQAMLTLENGAGAICDVSYLTPDSFAYEFPLYWRVEIWGSDGVLEGAFNSKTISLYRNGATKVEAVALPGATPGGYLDAFVQDVCGDTESRQLASRDAIAAARASLLVQHAADAGLANVPLDLSP